MVWAQVAAWLTIQANTSNSTIYLHASLCLRDWCRKYPHRRSDVQYSQVCFRFRVKSNENVTEKANLKTVPSNENVTEADRLLSQLLVVFRGRCGLGRRGHALVFPVHTFLKRRFLQGRSVVPTRCSAAHRSPDARPAGWCAGRVAVNAPGALHSLLLWQAGAHRVFGPHPTCASLCQRSPLSC